MVPNRRLGDRRSELRYEIVGEFWAILSSAQSMPLVNLGPGGLLAESTDPLIVGWIQRLRLRVRGEVAEVRATIRHVTPAPDRPDHYLVGMAFMDPSPAARRVIDAAIREQSSV